MDLPERRAMDVLERRARLTPEANPSPKLDYVVALDGRLPVGRAEAATVAVRYIPDRHIIAPAVFARYLEGVADLDWPGLEAMAAAILDDINNELVPRWVSVTVHGEADKPDVPGHAVMLEDRQPRWDNAKLLGRLRKF